MRTLKYFLENVVKHNSRVHHLSFSEHSYRKKLRIGYLWSWTLDMQTIFHNNQVILEEPWCYWNICMEWLTLESCFLISWKSGWSNQASFNINTRCLYIINMHRMEQKLLFYLMLMTVFIGIPLKLLETFLWTILERDSMWTSWYLHIGFCQLGFHKWRTILFQ